MPPTIQFLEPLRLIDFVLGLGDPDQAIKAHIIPWNLAQLAVQTKCNKIATGFMKKWPRFITTFKPHEFGRAWNPSSRIRNCHRSVPELFCKNYQSLLLAATSNLSFQFCPLIAHLKTVIYQLKVLPKPLLDEPLRVLWTLATTALLAANRIDTSCPFNPGDSGDSDETRVAHALPIRKYHKRKYHELLAELDRTMTHHHKMLQQDVGQNYLPTVLRDHRGTVAVHDRGRDSRLKAAMHWSNFHSDQAHAHPRSWNDSFLSLAVQFGLLNYVKSQLGSGNNSKILRGKKGRPLLDYALRPALPLPVPHVLVTPDMVKELLKHGARPNDKFEGRKCWEGALRWQYDVFAKDKGRMIFEAGGTTEDARRVVDVRAEMFMILLANGADPLASIETSEGNTISAIQALEDHLKFWATNEDLIGNLLREFH